MSDYRPPDPGATQVMPAMPPTSPPPPPSTPSGGPAPRRGIPWWGVLLIALAVGLLGAGIAWAVISFAGGGTDPALTLLQEQNADLQKKVDELSSEIATLSSEADTAKTTEPADAAATEELASGGTSTESGKQFCFVRNITRDAPNGPYRMVVDYAQFLTGAQATAAAAAHGDESPPPNDYYIVNDNPKLRTFPVKPGISVTVHGWGGGDAFAKSTVTFGQWFDVMPGGASPQDQWVRAPYWITLTGGQVTKIEQQYLP